VRALPQVEEARFDIPSETFRLTLAPGAGPEVILKAIADLGYEPELLERVSAPEGRLERLLRPTSKALAEALSRARAEDRPLVIDFGAIWCGPCRQFVTTTLADEAVSKTLAAHFVLLAIDVDEDPEAAADLGVAGIPDIWVIAPDGQVLARENRYLDVEAFLGLLRRFLP